MPSLRPRSAPMNIRPWLLSLLAVLALLTAACGGADYGVSSKTPLGTKAEYDEALKAKAQSTTELTPDKVAFYAGRAPETGFAKGLQGVEYNTTGEWVVALYEPSGKVKAVLCNLRSGSRKFSRLGKPLESFAARLWISTAKKDAEFAEKYENARTTAQYLTAAFGTPQKGGRWTKTSGSGSLSDIQTIVDQIAFWAP